MISEAISHVVAQVRAAGITATDDPRNLSLPGVLVGLHSLARQLDGSAEVTLRLLAIAPDAGPPSRRFDRLLAVLDAVGLVDAEAVTVTLPNHASTPLPALELVTTITITKE